MIVYGRNPVAELLRGRRAGGVHELWASAGALREPWLRAAQGRGLRVHRRPAEEIARLCGSDAHQGVAARADPYPYVAPDEVHQFRNPTSGPFGFLCIVDSQRDKPTVRPAT